MACCLPIKTEFKGVSSPRVLGRNLEAAGFVRPSGAAAHHIVAGLLPHAEDARQMLVEFDIDINTAENGVFLPANLKSSNPSGRQYTPHCTLTRTIDSSTGCSCGR